MGLDLGVTKSDGSPATVVLRDPSYDKPILDEKVPNSMLGIINVAGVVLTGFVGGFLPQYAFGGRGEGMPALSAAFVSVGVCTLAAGILRSYFGSLRPNFFAGCGWNNTLGACTTGWKGEHDDLEEGRRSFPSGHTASAYSTLFLLSLCLLRVARGGGSRRLAQAPAPRPPHRAGRAADDGRNSDRSHSGDRLLPLHRRRGGRRPARSGQRRSGGG